jgi:amino acid adenylation domain-containing protein
VTAMPDKDLLADVSLSPGRTNLSPGPARFVRRFDLVPAERMIARDPQRRSSCGLAAFQVLLYKYSGRSEFVIGTPGPSDGRTAIGVSARVAAAARFSDLWGQVQQSWQAAHGSSLPDWGGRTGFTGEPPLPGPELSPTGIRELNLGLEWADDRLRVEIAYDAGLYTESFLHALSGQFRRLLGQVLAGNDPLIREMTLLSLEEERAVLEGFNRTDSPFLARTFHQLFEDQVDRVPEAIAVVDAHQSLTYAVLDRRANQLAHQLIARGVAANTIVGLLVDRNVDAIVAMLAVLKAGGAYLPIETGFPTSRVRYMVEDSGCAVLLTQRSHAGNHGLSVPTLLVDDPGSYQGSDERPRNRSDLRDLAYVIYTSGSTGEPKGVPIHHEGVANLHHIFRSKFAIDERDNMTEFASFSFDTSVWEIVMCLLSGATLHVLPDALKANFAKLEQYLGDHNITVATFPPPYLANLEPSHVRGLRKLLVAGSECSAKLLRRWQQQVAFHNAYGPTEASVCVAVYDASREPFEGDTVPIGRPLLNKRIYVVGPDRQLQPVGAQGELWVSGVGTSRGYLNQPELTRDRFVDNPFAGAEPRTAHRVAYRTGDLARWRPDGCLEFIGRQDNQVKVRGYRIELDEVDAALARIAGVTQAAAVLTRDSRGENEIWGFYTSGTGLAPDSLRAALVQRVPDFMIPSRLLQLEHLPLTNSDKVDRKALTKLAADTAAVASEQAAVAPAEAPGSDLFSRLKQILISAAELPGNSAEISDTAKLDTLGINSLQFMRIVVALEKEFSMEFDEDFLLSGRSLSVAEIVQLIQQRSPGG